MRTSSFVPEAARSSTAPWMPARCAAPYAAAGPVRLSDAPMTAPLALAGAAAPVDSGPPLSLQAAEAISSRTTSDQRRAGAIGSPLVSAPALSQADGVRKPARRLAIAFPARTVALDCRGGQARPHRPLSPPYAGPRPSPHSHAQPGPPR